jgi:hypothetical protein
VRKRRDENPDQNVERHPPAPLSVASSARQRRDEKIDLIRRQLEDRRRAARDEEDLRAEFEEKQARFKREQAERDACQKREQAERDACQKRDQAQRDANQAERDASVAAELEQLELQRKQLERRNLLKEQESKDAIFLLNCVDPDNQADV